MRNDAYVNVNLLQKVMRDGLPTGAYFFETPGTTSTLYLRQPFEFVLIRSRSLTNATADPKSFSEHFSLNRGRSVVVFNNLKGDSRLVAPCPMKSEIQNVYTHLAVFNREAQYDQVEKKLFFLYIILHSSACDKPAVYIFSIFCIFPS